MPLKTSYTFIPRINNCSSISYCRNQYWRAGAEIRAFLEGAGKINLAAPYLLPKMNFSAEKELLDKIRESALCTVHWSKSSRNKTHL